MQVFLIWWPEYERKQYRFNIYWSEEKQLKKLMDKNIMVMAVHHGGYNNKEILWDYTTRPKIILFLALIKTLMCFFLYYVRTKGILDLSVLQNKTIKKYSKHWDADADSGWDFKVNNMRNWIKIILKYTVVLNYYRKGSI